jgi:hypothetical protein
MCKQHLAHVFNIADRIHSHVVSAPRKNWYLLPAFRKVLVCGLQL